MRLENEDGIEAELDIQFIMGVAPGIQTEFWEFPEDDFGAGLNQWSSKLTQNDDVPLVHSISYGWQGLLAEVFVKESDVRTHAIYIAYTRYGSVLKDSL